MIVCESKLYGRNHVYIATWDVQSSQPQDTILSVVGPIPLESDYAAPSRLAWWADSWAIGFHWDPKQLPGVDFVDTAWYFDHDQEMRPIAEYTAGQTPSLTVYA